MPKGIKGFQKGELNHMWKGDRVEYSALHEWIKNNKSKPDFCECCKVNRPRDLANISSNYHRDVNDFEWLCRECHMKKDNRLHNLIVRNRTQSHNTEVSEEARESMRLAAKNRLRDCNGRFIKVTNL